MNSEVETSRIMNKHRQDDEGGLDLLKNQVNNTRKHFLDACFSDHCVGLFDFVLAKENKLEWLKEGFVIFHSDSLTQMESLKQYL